MRVLTLCQDLPSHTIARLSTPRVIGLMADGVNGAPMTVGAECLGRLVGS